MLDAAHIRPVEHNGSDHPMNGLMLCANHHRAFDSRLFFIKPNEGKELVLNEGHTLEKLGISKTSIAHLENQPHIDAPVMFCPRFSYTYDFTKHTAS